MITPTAYEVMRFSQFIERNEWRYAKTMPQNPHFYALRRQCADDVRFIEAVEFIRRYGYDSMFYRMKLRYADFDGWQYWTMGSVIEATILINRARIDRDCRELVLNPVRFVGKPAKPGELYVKR